MVGKAYAFAPATTAGTGKTLAYSIQNLPSWAKFSTTTGQLSGTPATGNVGVFSNIIISVSDGTTTVALPSFTITVAAANSGTATVLWIPPTTNTNGTPLTDLSGYHIYYGTSPTALTKSVAITGATTTSYQLTGLSAGTWYFGVAADSSAGTESAISGVASKII
jgi:hypothetical protein